MILIGINAYHGDASACLVIDGTIVAAAEEERFRRIKHWAGFPSMAIGYCLEEAGVPLAEVDHIAVNGDPRANLVRRASYAILNRPDLRLILDRVRNQAKRASIADEMSRAFPCQPFRGTVHRVEHHLAHLASAFLVSPFEEAVTVSVDGFGDFSSAAWGTGRGRSISVDGRVWFPHSLGVFYQAITQYLGFPHYGDEYKVMGLAPYGEPRHLDKMRRIVDLLPDGSFALDLAYFRHHREKIPYQWDGGIPSVGTLYSDALADLLGPARAKDEPLSDFHRDIARSAQAMYEEAFFHLLGRLHERYQIDSLALAGGCAMNSVANGKVRRMSPFKRLYVQSAAGDAGGAIGAAMHVWHRLTGEDAANAAKGPKAAGVSRARATGAKTAPSALAGDDIVGRTVMDHAYLGPGTDDGEVTSLIAGRAADIEAQGCSVATLRDESELCGRVASAIADGKVVGWFQGRLEWGPRALGNRSIVCDPRRADMKDILNLKIKRRESFRPFAPSIQREHVAAWFEEDDDVPFMMQVYQIRADQRAKIPAVCHVDGSGRLQTVHRETNPRYWALIEAFKALTGVPIMLNTSFNENEPVVCRPVEALDCFLRTNMDVLVLGDWLIERRSPR
ncbi:MAG: carbamoyltransferase C-terminal domain-containing protein [Hyphomicrobiaceae bacterium]|nr:carbamoyltransferase C-terminal domain-containing protein [Hyphomicrobiaceae bacterium]